MSKEYICPMCEMEMNEDDAVQRIIDNGDGSWSDELLCPYCLEDFHHSESILEHIS